MADLRTMVKTFLEAEGYHVVSDGGQPLTAERIGLDDDVETIQVWVDDGEPKTFHAREGSLTRAFGEAKARTSTAARRLLVPSLAGLSTDFRSTVLRDYQVKVTVPAQFFDTQFRWDLSRPATTAAAQLRIRGEETARLRIPQPYVSSRGEAGGDAFDALFGALTTPGGSAVHIVAAPAGAGKSFLFEALFSAIYQKFTSDKQASFRSPRPLPLLPEYLALGGATTVRGLVDEFLATDFVRRISIDLFTWMLTNGGAMWMLDGLDEVLTKDSSLFELCLDVLSDPAATTLPKVLICVRDSLLDSNEDLLDLASSYPDIVTTYRLEPWDEVSLQAFAKRRFKEASGPFMTTVTSRPDLTQMASNAFYAGVIADIYEAGKLSKTYEEATLLEEAFASIVNRERGKGLSPLLDDLRVREFAETVAITDFQHGFEGVEVPEAREYAELVLPDGLTDEAVDHCITQLTQLAVFAGAGDRRLQFAQELIEHFLIGVGLSGRWAGARGPERVAEELSRRLLPPDSLSIRLLARHIRAHKEFKALCGQVLANTGSPVTWKNLLAVALQAMPAPDALRREEVVFAQQDLSGLRFADCDLDGVKFDGCNLADTQFVNCGLRGASLSGAIVKGTTLEMTEAQVEGLDLGDMSNFYSATVNGEYLDHPDAMVELANRWQVGHRATRDVCPAALQLRHLVGKFVHPTGQRRRSWLDRRGVLAGTVYGDPQATLDAAIREGYVREGMRGRIERAEGDRYAELVAFISGNQVSTGLRAVLEQTCDVPGCRHLTAAY